MKRIIMLLTVALVMAAMMVASVMPAFAQGGCQEFGVQGVSDQARNQPGGMGGYASFFGPQDAMDDVIHQSQADFC
jgi:hypothetical protein